MLLNGSNKALESLEKAITIEPNNHEYWYGRCLILYDLKRHQEAIVSIDKAITIEPENDEYWYWQGKFLINCSLYESEN